jgi:hypothetical protein
MRFEVLKIVFPICIGGLKIINENHFYTKMFFSYSLFLLYLSPSLSLFLSLSSSLSLSLCLHLSLCRSLYLSQSLCISKLMQSQKFVDFLEHMQHMICNVHLKEILNWRNNKGYEVFMIGLNSSPFHNWLI